MSTEFNSTSFTKEMQRGFSEYASYVISERALPDGRDGLKPVHRRILWAMHEMGIGPRSAHKKCARIVGETTGKYHPHAGGVYESLVRLAQDWSLRYPLVHPQGNFGSIDGYPPAAMRYTEARLARISTELLEKISPAVVPFIENFDGSEIEPVVLPVKIPHLLLNGSYGIAVGISCNIPPHNLTELMNACLVLIDNPMISIEDINKIVTAPDFPTGGIIIGLRGIQSLFNTGIGSLRIRSKTHLETPKTHKVRDSMIVVTEIPYLQNKSKIIEHIASLIDDGKIRGVKDVRDLSKDEIRIEILIHEQYADELGVQTILAQLFKSTNLEILFHSRINAFVYGAPRTLNLKQALLVFLDFREQTVKAIAQEELEKILARLHILEGLLIAADNIDEIIKMIRASGSRADAQKKLMANYKLSELQAKAVLDMTLGRLAKVEQDAIQTEANEKIARKNELDLIIKDRPTLLTLMKEEFQKILDNNTKDKRKTVILAVDDVLRPGERPILHQRDLLVTTTNLGYVRTIEYGLFKLQGRGGKGVAGVPLDASGEIIYDMNVISNLDDVLLFTEEGKVFQFQAYELPEVKRRTSKGTRLKRHMPDIDGNVVKIVNVDHDKFSEDRVLVTVSKKGIVKRTTLDKYGNIRRTGIKGLILKDDDEVVEAFVTDNNSYIFIATKDGSAVLFDETLARLTGRVAQGVKGITLRPNDEVVSAFSITKEAFDNTSIFTITNKGRGKRTPVNKYRITKRGAKGVINIRLKGHHVITSMPVPTDSINDNISLINSQGIIIKVRVGSIRNMGRSTQGVRVMRLRGSETLLLATSVEDSEDSEALEVEDQGPPNEENGDLEASESQEEINEDLDEELIKEENEDLDEPSENLDDSVEDSDD